jgi:hypothetical protein
MFHGADGCRVIGHQDPAAVRRGRRGRPLQLQPRALARSGSHRDSQRKRLAEEETRRGRDSQRKRLAEEELQPLHCAGCCARPPARRRPVRSAYCSGSAAPADRPGTPGTPPVGQRPDQVTKRAASPPAGPAPPGTADFPTSPTQGHLKQHLHRGHTQHIP